MSVAPGDTVKFYTDGWNANGWGWKQPGTYVRMDNSKHTGIIYVPSDITTDARVYINNDGTRMVFKADSNNKSSCEGWTMTAANIYGSE